MRYHLSLVLCFAIGASCCAIEPVPQEWTASSAREEIRPKFHWHANGGPDGSGELSISADNREGLAGYWTRSFAVEGGHHYRFAVTRATEKIDLPRRATIARILWADDNGKPVRRDQPSNGSYRAGEKPRAEPEFLAVASSEDGWTTLESVYRAPFAATHAHIELHFRWGPPKSSVRWSLPKVTEVSRPNDRIVRLATIHYQPRDGQSKQEKCVQFAPLIAKAAAKNADLVVLPETLTYYGTKGGFADAAESVPGPSTDYFGSLAKQHDLYLVVGLVERVEHLLFNVAVLIGPDGNVVGKYRKVTLPRGEIEGGITPGNEYPVFETRFGKIGMMVCYDGFFPEVARELSHRGAEVIAWPVWGCNPMLAAARACENHVFLVSSTYTDYASNWMISAVYGHDGKPLAHAENWGDVVVAEVNLDQPLHWHSLGDFKAQIQAHRPVVDATP